MRKKKQAIPPTPPGKIATTARDDSKDIMTMMILFRQDREEYHPDASLKKELDIRTGWYIKSDSYQDCIVLNNYYTLLSDVLSVDPKAIEVQSMVTFIDEACEHPKYCTTSMLRKFSNYIFQALDEPIPSAEDLAKGFIPSSTSYGFLDYADDNGNARLGSDFALRSMGVIEAITPETLHDIHVAINKPAEDAYRCQSDNLSRVLIQICYAILMHYFRQGQIIKRCENCRRIFIPDRANMKYCTRKSPQDDSLSCGQYAKREKQRVHNDTAMKREYMRILHRLDYSESEEFKLKYRQTKHNSKKREALLNEWAKRYPKREKKGE